MMRKEFWLVLVGAVLGGSFWFCAQLVAGKPFVEANMWIVPAAILGSLAAAFGGVYLQSEIDASDDKNSGKVIAMASMAAIAFPSMISSPIAFSDAAVGAELKLKNEKVTEDAKDAVAAQKETLESAEVLSAEDFEKIEEDLETLKEKKLDTEITVEVAAQIDKEIKELLDPLAERAKDKPTEAEDIAKIIRKIGEDKEASETLSQANEQLVKVEAVAPEESKAGVREQKDELAKSYEAGEKTP